MFVYSISKFFNAVQKDFIIDWLEMYGKSAGFHKKKSAFQQKLFASGINIENKIFDLLKQTFNQDSDGNSLNNIIDLTRLKFQNFTHKERTLKHLRDQQKPLMIYQAFLCGSDEFGNERPFGIPDLIMRKDIVKKLMKKNIEDTENLKEIEETKEEDLGKTEDKNDYVIVDMKKSLKLNKDNTVSKSTNNYNWLEFQLCCYEKFLAHELQRPPQSVYVLSLDKSDNIIIGRIPYVEQDIKTKIEYLKKLSQEGHKWVPYPVPTNDYMYPNMKNTYDFVWRDVKLEIAKKIGELTLLPYMTIEIRRELWNNCVRTYKTANCVDVLKSLNKVPEYVLEIIKANQDIGLEINAEKVKEDLLTQINNRKLVFVDLETSQKGKVFLSCVYDQDKKEHTQYYCCKSELSDNNVLEKTKTLIKGFNKDEYCVIYYAGQEEKMLEIQNGIDLYQILRKHNYAKSGVFSYQLKEIYNNTFRRKIETSITNGLDAMNLYEEDDEKHKNNLCEYVKKDVDVMVKLVSRFLSY
jgi:hypothetical protein